MNHSASFNINGVYHITQIQDLEELLEVFHFFKNEFNPPLCDRLGDLSLYVKKINKYAQVYAIIQDNVYAGFVCLYVNDYETKTAYIAQIAVNSKEQKKGWGFILMQKCIDIAQKNGMNIMKLEVSKLNRGAIKFYKKNGFDFYGAASKDSFYMVKKIREKNDE